MLRLTVDGQVLEASRAVLLDEVVVPVRFHDLKQSRYAPFARDVQRVDGCT